MDEHKVARKSQIWPQRFCGEEILAEIQREIVERETKGQEVRSVCFLMYNLSLFINN